MFRVSDRENGRSDDGGQCAQPLDDGACLFQSTHVSVTGRKKAVSHGKSGPLLDRRLQLWERDFELPFKGMRSTYRRQRCAHPIQRIEPQRLFDLFNRDVVLPRIHPEHPAPEPAVSKARVGCERPIYQRERRPDVFAEIAEHGGRARKNKRIVAGGPNGTASVIEASIAGDVRRFRPTIPMKLLHAHRCQSERGAIERIAIAQNQVTAQ